MFHYYYFKNTLKYFLRVKNDILLQRAVMASQDPFGNANHYWCSVEDHILTCISVNMLLMKLSVPCL